MSRDKELPNCPSYMAHPQAVWFEIHWKPEFENLQKKCNRFYDRLQIKATEIIRLKKELLVVRGIQERRDKATGIDMPVVGGE